MNNTRKSHSFLFLTELMIALLFFALSSTVCVRLFVQASLISQSAAEQNKALLLTESMAEEFRASGGTLTTGSTYYDANWSVCSKEQANYTKHIKVRNKNNVKIANISIFSDDIQSPIYALEVKICP